MNDKIEQALDVLYTRDKVEEARALAASRQRIGDILNNYAYDGMVWDVAGYLWFVVGPRGLVAVQMGQVDEATFVEKQSARLKQVLVRDTARTEPIKQQLGEYLTGQRTGFDVSIDWSQMTDFQAKVLRQALQIPAGKVLTYGDVAREIGKPKSARAVGRALGTNPMPIIIPCHRVIASDGSLTGYIGGMKVKAHLLRLEGYVA